MTTRERSRYASPERGLAAIGADQDGAAAKADEAKPSEQMAKRGRSGLQRQRARVVPARIASWSATLGSPPKPAPPNRRRRR
jgi:hypothetical protein